MPTPQEVFINAIISNFVPNTYTKLTSNGSLFQIQKGQLNKVRLRPRIVNEHVESSREALDEVNSTTVVGQIFKASQNNINGMGITLESAESSSFDNFESYANDAALQAVYVKGGTDEVTLETTIFNSGSQAMAIPSTNNDGLWTRTVSSTDYTDYNFNFEYQQTHMFVNQKVSFFIGDGTNTKSIQLNITDINTWTTFEINEKAMSVTADDLTGTTPTMTAITKVGFRIDTKRNGSTGYIDDMVTVPPPGQIELKLWDLGTSLPVGDGASFDLTNDAAQYTEIGDRGIGGEVSDSLILNLNGGKHLYDTKGFIAGTASEISTNTVLTIGNYYAITLHYVDTDVNVYGPDTTFSTDYYQNGYAFFTTAENVDITTIPGAAGSGAFSDLMFTIFSIQPVYIIGYNQINNATPGSNAQENIYLEDSNMSITDTIVAGSGALLAVNRDISLRPMFLEVGGKFELYYSDDFTDDVSTMELDIEYLHKPPTVNG